MLGLFGMVSIQHNTWFCVNCTIQVLFITAFQATACNFKFNYNMIFNLWTLYIGIDWEGVAYVTF